MLGLTCMMLASCSSGNDYEVNAVTVAKGFFSKNKKPAQPDQQQLAASVQAAMNATDAPLILVAISGRNVVSVMQKIETNGPYDTYGTSDRRSITLKRGILTASRGLGEDIMSSDVAPVLSLVTNRRAGSAQRVHRYLDGENVIVPLEATCTVRPGGRVRVVAGDLNREAIAVTEDCRAQTTEFQNSYQVDVVSGRILQSRQWISPMNGYIVIQSLR